MLNTNRTFNDWLKRDLMLFVRGMNLMVRWHFHHKNHPIKAMFTIKKFRKIESLIKQARIDNNKKGFNY